ncbi:MAG: hypothetical protein ABFR05_06960 [Bacteroidota bacterium]
MTLNNKISQLPSEQSVWLSTIKSIFQRTFNSKTEIRTELIVAIEKKAIERGFDEIGLLLDYNDIEEYFEN